MAYSETGPQRSLACIFDNAINSPSVAAFKIPPAFMASTFSAPRSCPSSHMPTVFLSPFLYLGAFLSLIELSIMKFSCNIRSHVPLRPTPRAYHQLVFQLHSVLSPYLWDYSTAFQPVGRPRINGTQPLSQIPPGNDILSPPPSLSSSASKSTPTPLSLSLSPRLKVSFQTDTRKDYPLLSDHIYNAPQRLRYWQHEGLRRVEIAAVGREIGVGLTREAGWEAVVNLLSLGKVEVRVRIKEGDM